MNLSFASKYLPPYTALTISMSSRGGVKINGSCYMMKLDFKKMVPVCRFNLSHIYYFQPYSTQFALTRVPALIIATAFKNLKI